MFATRLPLQRLRGESMSQHHFIVVYDTELGWSWDTEVEEARFSGTIYLPESNEWVSSSHTEGISERDNEASDQLCQAIRVMNGEM